MTPAEQLKEKILSLEQALLSVHPTMPVLLRDIHEKLKQDAEIVTLLSEEEIEIIVRGLKQQTKTELATSLLKSAKSSTTKSLKKIGVSDL